MAHTYQHCPEDHVRMVMFEKDEEGDRRFYGCRNCNTLITKMPARHALAHGWPGEVMKRAISAGWLTEDGKVQG